MGELVEIVNEMNEVIRVVDRSVMRKERLPHRATYVALCDRQGRFLVEVRTLSKDYAPGLLDACVGGVVTAGEDPDVAARRELFEEVGVDASSEKVRLERLGAFKIPSGDLFLYGYLYYAVADAITRRQASEVSGIMYLKEDELLALRDNFAPDSLVAFEEILRRHKAQRPS